MFESCSFYFIMTEQILNPRSKPQMKVIVIDLGSYQTKAGMSGDDIPRHFIKSVFGTLKTFDIQGHNIDLFIGSEAVEKSDANSLYNPFKNGLITNPDDIDRLLHHIFEKELQINQEKKSVLITTPLNGPQSQRNTIAEILFEKYKIGSLHMSTPTKLGLYTTSKFTGTVIDCGESFTQISSIFDMLTIPQASIVSDIAGSTVTVYLQRAIKDLSYLLNGASGREIVRDFKEKHCFVLQKGEIKDPPPLDYTINPTTTVRVGNDRFTVPELLFTPDKFGLKGKGIPAMIYDSIMRCDISIRAELFNNIVLTGGTTLLEGLQARIQKEMEDILESNEIRTPVNVVALPNRGNASWIGGSIVGRLEAYPSLLAYKDEYQELGASLISSRFY